MKILIVEDENIIALELESYIVSLGHESIGTASSAQGAFGIIEKTKPDLVLMDICIKGEIDGIQTASQIAQYDPSVKFIFLTAHTNSYNIDRAIVIDPISYLAKPYNLKELEASIKIAQYKIDRNVPTLRAVNSLLQLDHEFSYDQDTHTLYYLSTVVNLTKKESDLLALLMQYRQKIVDHYTIENNLWPDKEANSNTLRTLVKRLRPKLKYRFIRTFSGQGYMLEV